jgi:hypothetical protein
MFSSLSVSSSSCNYRKKSKDEVEVMVLSSKRSSASYQTSH